MHTASLCVAVGVATLSSFGLFSFSRCKMFSIVCWQFRFWLARSTAVRSVAVYECVCVCVAVCVCVVALKQKRLNYLKVARAQVPLLLPHLLSFCAIFYAVDFPFRLFQISQRTPPPSPPSARPRVTPATPLGCYACQFIPCY